MIEAIVSASLHAILTSIVLGALLLGIVATVVKFAPLRASARHTLWTTALIAMAIMPLAGLGVSAYKAVSVATVQSNPSIRKQSKLPAIARAREESSATSKPDVVQDATPPNFALHIPSWQPHLTRVVALAVVAIWIVGALIGLIGLAASVVRVRGLKRRSSPLEGERADDLPWLTENMRGEREIYLRLSYETETPVAIGFGRPVILIPTELANAGGLGAIEALVMHEHAHLRRYDDYTNLLQRLIERIFWFNPIVWIVGRRIALEREIASDDAVVERTGQPQEYAKSLWRLAREMRMPEHAIVAPGAMLTRKQISVRIESLLEGRASVSAFTPLAALGVGAAAVGCVIAVATSAPALELPVPPVPVSAAQPVVAPSPAAPPKIAREHVVAPIVVRIPHIVAVVSPEPVPLVTVSASLHVPAIPALPNRLANVPEPALPAQAIPPVPADLTRSILKGVSQAVRKSLAANFGSSDRDTIPANADRSTLAKILASCMGCDLSGRDLRGVDLRGLKLLGADLHGADMRGARLDGVSFTSVDLNGADLRGASLVNARFTGVDISGISLHGANTRGLQMVGVSLDSMDLRGLDLRSMLAKCTGCSLANADLRGVDLRGTWLVAANLSNANLADANLSGANVSGANLNKANLSNANLRNATLNGSSLANTNLSGADTTGAHFTGAKFQHESR